MTRAPIFILARTPGASQTVEWTTICRRKTPYLVINHEPRRDTSRWVSVDRKRPFAVYWCGLTSPLSRHTTLDRAFRAAQAAREEMTP
jgi:hypothetical protein